MRSLTWGASFPLSLTQISLLLAFRAILNLQRFQSLDGSDSLEDSFQFSSLFPHSTTRGSLSSASRASKKSSRSFPPRRNISNPPPLRLTGLYSVSRSKRRAPDAISLLSTSLPPCSSETLETPFRSLADFWSFVSAASVAPPREITFLPLTLFFGTQLF